MIEWTPDVEAAYHEQVNAVAPEAIDRAVTAVCDAVEKACGNRLAAADFPLRFVVAAVLASLAPAAARHPFTPRQLEIARMAAKGLTDKQIASELYVSHRTVQVHLAHVFDKVGVNTRTALSAWMHSNGLDA